jgi:hypothetical protein
LKEYWVSSVAMEWGKDRLITEEPISEKDVKEWYGISDKPWWKFWS